MGSLRIGRAARGDLAVAVSWYVERSPGLELRFIADFERVLDRIEHHPRGYAVVYRDVRRANLREFPYGVFFHRRGETWFVLAVLHHSKDPRSWPVGQRAET